MSRLLDALMFLVFNNTAVMFIFIFIIIETWFAHKHKYRSNFKHYFQRSFQLIRRIISIHHCGFLL